MKITIKTLQQKQFQVIISSTPPAESRTYQSQIDAEGSDTVADMKAKIKELQGNSPESQKLIYSGEQRPTASDPISNASSRQSLGG